MRRDHGFTLIEVLVAMVITAVALLGLAASQIKAMQYAQQSLQYTIAGIESVNVMERIWPDLCALQGGRTAPAGTALTFDTNRYVQTGALALPNLAITLPAHNFTQSPYTAASTEFLVRAQLQQQRQSNADALSMATRFPWLVNGNPNGC